MEKVLRLFGLTFSSKSTGLLFCTLSYKVESSKLIVLIVVMVKIDQLYSDWICWFSVYSVQSVYTTCTRSTLTALVSIQLLLRLPECTRKTLTALYNEHSMLSSKFVPHCYLLYSFAFSQYSFVHFTTTIDIMSTTVHKCDMVSGLVPCITTGVQIVD